MPEIISFEIIIGHKSIKWFAYHIDVYRWMGIVSATEK